MTALSQSAAADGVVIVGGGQAGGRTAEALRKYGFTGAITLVGEEVHLPYERPSLSKEMLIDLEAETIAWVRAEEVYHAEGIGLRMGVRAIGIDRAARRVALSDGSSIGYGALVLATGGRVRKLAVPGADHPACLYIRTLDDSRKLRRRLGPDLRLVVVGAGFIGLEVAAAARRHGAAVTVLEVGARPMGRAVPPVLGDFYARLHTGKGVDLRLGEEVVSIADAGGQAVVQTRSGGSFPADIVVIGVGIVPNDELAGAAGLPVERGIVVDAFGATADPLVTAAGDVARHFNPLLGQSILLESWQNAQNQALAVARNIAGTPTEYAEIPWFWSDQYGINLQIAGLPAPDAEIIVRGTLDDAVEGGAALLLQVTDDRLVCAAGLNAARDVRVAKELMTRTSIVDAAKLRDPAVKMTDILKAAKKS